MFELESFMQTRYLEGFDGTTIREAVAAPRLDSTGYAKAWSIVHFLAKTRRKEFNEYVCQIGKLGPMKGMVARPGEPVVANLEHFHAFFGQDLESLEQEMVKYLGKQDYQSPVGDFVHYVGMAVVPHESGEKRYACFFHNKDKVEEWKEALARQLTPEQRNGSEWQVQKVNNRNAANNAIKGFLGK